jgi:predicted ATPase
VTAASERPAEQLKAALRHKRLLLLLDNYEQVLEAAPLVAELLAAAPSLNVLATSRVVLHLSGEHEYAVSPLALPPTNDHRRTTTDHRPTQGQAETISEYAAVQLFIQRAQAVKAGFAVTNANAPAIAEICVRLDGLPLAIELAAARVKLFPPEALLSRLAHPLALLTGGARDLPQRQQTIRSTIDWSYNLLSVDAQRLFRHLGVFVGGFTFEAAEAVASEGKGQEAKGKRAERDMSFLPLTFGLLPLLEALVDHSLLIVLEPVGGEPRYGMLELVREYALEQLRETDDEQATRRRHALYQLKLVEAVSPKVGGPESRDALNQLETELPNIRAAFVWAGAAGEHNLALQLAAALLPLWLNLGHRGEGSAMLQTVLSQPGVGSPIIRARSACLAA